MIVAFYEIEEEPAKRAGMMFILEPTNVEKLTMGQPIIKNLRELWPGAPADIQILIGYTPDAVWVSENAERLGLAKAIMQSRDRAPVYLRDAESLEKKHGPIKP